MTSKSRTITLTGRRPVRIADADWPIIAEAKDDGLPDQALWLKVRQHADGRCIVYGGVDDTGHYRAGELIPDLDVALGAIQRVASDLGIPRDLAQVCFAALPAEELL